MQVTVQERQSLFDIALRVAGGIEAAIAIALQNDLSLTEPIAPGTVLNCSGIPVINQRIVNYYAANGINPATGITQQVNPPARKRIFDRTFDYTFE